MTNNDLQQTISKMRNYIRRDVAAGFSSADEICTSIVELFSDELDSSVLFPYVKDIVAEHIELHLKEQMNWQKTTDCDRIDQAFEDLESKGIVSRQNYSCCGTCGSGEIRDEMLAIQSTGKNVRGYTFYHAQDTESAVDGEGLYLNYGSIEEEDTAHVKIGHEIVSTINQHHLETVWDGDLRARIFVKLKWQRRR